MRYPLHAWLILLSPSRIADGLSRLQAQHIAPVPTLWQVELGVLRMWHRMIFRSETIGTCSDDPVRDTWRARLMQYRPLRFFGLVYEGAIAPWDLSGMLSSRERLIRHLIGAHHDGDQFVYDFQILASHPGALEELQARTAAVVNDTDARSGWLKDLTVYAHYHERLLAAVEAFQADTPLRPAALTNPDLTFSAWLRWCADQPQTPAETVQAWRAGALDWQGGVQA